MLDIVLSLQQNPPRFFVPIVISNSNALLHLLPVCGEKVGMRGL
jgi:hypothetical protein